MTLIAASLLGDLRGKAGIVTGAAGGIGAASSRQLAALGAHVALIDLGESKVEATAASIREAGGKAIALTATVADYHAIEAAIDEAVARLGSLDFAILAAGVADDGTLAEGDPRLWKHAVDVNLLGVLYSARATFRHLQKAGGGDVIILGSVSGLETYEGEPIYLATKWGLTGLGRSLRKEGRPDHIRVTLVEPGLVDTALSRCGRFGAQLLESTRPLQPEDVADMIVFALLQPSYADLGEIVLRPLDQEL